MLDSAGAVARAAGVSSSRFAYESAGKTPTHWLGPDILDAIGMIATEGRTHVLSVPFAFVCDHREILCDIDTEAIERADHLGLNVSRIEIPSTTPSSSRCYTT